MRETVTKYKPDAIWMDGDWNINADICWCDNCKKAWQLKTGKTAVPTKPNDPDWPAWLRFHLERCYEYRKIMADAVHEAHPGCMYTSNGGYRIKSARKGGSGRWDDPLTAPGYIGTLSQDVAANGEPVGPMTKTRSFAMALSPEQDTPHDLMHQAGRGENQISVPRLRQWAGLAMASGSAALVHPPYAFRSTLPRR